MRQPAFTVHRWVRVWSVIGLAFGLAAVTLPATAEMNSRPTQSGTTRLGSSQSDGLRPNGIECGQAIRHLRDSEEPMTMNYCYKFDRTTPHGGAITINGTEGWWAQAKEGEGEDRREVKIELSVLSADGTSAGIKRSDSSDRSEPYGVAQISPNGTWSAVIPFPTNENARTSDGEGDIDALLKPGALLRVSLESVQHVTKPAGSDRPGEWIRITSYTWATVTRSAQFGEYAPRLTEQPESLRNGGGSRAVTVAPKVTGQPRANSVWQFFDDSDETDFDTWSTLERNVNGVSTVFTPDREFIRDPWGPPYYGPRYMPYPTRRAIVINEVGNTVTETVNSAVRPENDPVTKNSAWLVDEPQFRGQFGTAKRVRRGQNLIIGWGADRPGQRLAPIIFKDSAYKSFGWRETNSLGRVTIKIPRNCSPGMHKLAVYNGAGYIVGWNWVEVL